MALLRLRAAPWASPDLWRRISRAFVPLVWLIGASCEEADPETNSPYVQRGADIALSEPFASPVEAPLDISSTFGPRWKFSDSRYDFHRGIDYYGSTGDPILAIGEGQVTGLYAESSAQYPNGGNVLVVRHDLSDPFTWQDRAIDRLYAVYLHLDSFAVVLDETVSEGQVIADIGISGDTVFPHLHFEIRLQTVCSLEFQLGNPDSACAGYGFDPHVHPYAVVGGENADRGLELDSEDGPPFALNYSATRGDLDLNELRTDLGALNFNRRTGIDADSTAALDDFDYGWVTVIPGEFVSESETITYRFEFAERPAYAELLDIHGFGIRAEF